MAPWSTTSSMTAVRFPLSQYSVDQHALWARRYICLWAGVLFGSPKCAYRCWVNVILESLGGAWVLMSLLLFPTVSFFSTSHCFLSIGWLLSCPFSRGNLGLRICSWRVWVNDESIISLNLLLPNYQKNKDFVLHASMSVLFDCLIDDCDLRLVAGSTQELAWAMT